MQKGIIGKKIGMTQIFDEHGKVVPVTVIEAGPCVISQKKTVENDGYAAVQMGYGDMKAHKVNKPMQGHFAKGDVAPKKVLREFRLENTDAYNVGDLVKVDVFAAGDKVDVCGTSKGKGYAGGIKRWNLHRLKETHGSGPVAPPRWFQRRMFRSVQSVQGQASARPPRCGEGHRPELDRRQGGRRKQPHRRQRRSTGSERRHRRDP